jgi:serine/threonine protein kinase
MLLPVGYRLINTICSGSNTSIFLAAREGTKGESTVILKTFAHTPQGANELRFLQREYELVKSFSGQPGILQYKGVESGADVHYLVIESSEGILLRTYLQLQTPGIETVLTIAYRLAEVVDLIHQHRVLHRISSRIIF